VERQARSRACRNVFRKTFPTAFLAVRRDSEWTTISSIRIQYDESIVLGTRLLSLPFAVLLCAGFCWTARAEPAGADPVQQPLAFAHGDYGIARQSFAKAWQIAQGLPANAPIRYEILKRPAATSVASGQFAEAERYLQSAVEWRESTVDPKEDPKILDDLLLSIILDLRTNDFDRALTTAQRVQAVHTATYTADSLPVADDFLRIGQIYRAEGKLQEAVHALSTAYNLRMKLAGSLDPGLLPILDELNESFRAIEGGPGTGSESLYRQALMIRETLYGDYSTELISTLEWLAGTYDAGGEYDHAEPVYERMLSLWERLVGKDHPNAVSGGVAAFLGKGQSLAVVAGGSTAKCGHHSRSRNGCPFDGRAVPASSQCARRIPARAFIYGKPVGS
jgi:tetratricopeptide (TPR) repeat protein